VTVRGRACERTARSRSQRRARASPPPHSLEALPRRRCAVLAADGLDDDDDDVDNANALADARFTAFVLAARLARACVRLIAGSPPSPHPTAAPPPPPPPPPPQQQQQPQRLIIFYRDYACCASSRPMAARCGRRPRYADLARTSTAHAVLIRKARVARASSTSS
jgi:hypothetical protein